VSHAVRNNESPTNAKADFISLPFWHRSRNKWIPLLIKRGKLWPAPESRQEYLLLLLMENLDDGYLAVVPPSCVVTGNRGTG